MKPQQFLVGVLFGALLALSQVAEGASPASTCDASACVISSNCRCSSAVSPLDGDLADWPQLISLTFDEAVTEDLYNSYWNEILLKTEQKNPDGEFISATFFVPHEYTNYKRVNDLYNYGFEIAVHSISKNPLQEYWRTATEDLLTQEFGGQKEIISKFANIPKEAITGVRTPQLQLAGNNSIAAYVASELSYDSSWPSLNNMFPYTLDYASTQPCLLGAECPNEAFPGFWVLPINDLRGPNNTECNTLATCGTTGTADEIKDWLVNQIETVRTSSKTPMNLLVNSYWFNQTENSLEGFKLFLSAMQEKSDVYFVSQKQVMEFIKNPVQLSDFKTDPSPDLANCNTQTCRLKKGTEDRNMVSCVDCPDVYPWIGNPDGTN